MNNGNFTQVPVFTDGRTVVIYDASLKGRVASDSLLHPFPEESFKTYFLKNLGASFVFLGILGLIYGGSPFLTAKAIALLKTSQRKPVVLSEAKSKKILACIPEQKIDPNDFYLIIEKLNLKSQVIPFISPTNKDEYEKALKKGLAHAKSSYLPGENKLVYIFGHSSIYPWLIENIDAVFFNLDALSIGDEVIIRYNKRIYPYKIYQKTVVKPEEISLIEKHNSDNILVLQTCYPTGTDWLRLLIFAQPIVDKSDVL